MVKTNEAFISEIAEKNPNVEILGVYTKAHNRIEVRCKKCNYTWMTDKCNCLKEHKCDMVAEFPHDVVY